MRTRFFVCAAILAFLLVPLAPDELIQVPLWTGIVYVVLSIMSLLDHLSRRSKK